MLTVITVHKSEVVERWQLQASESELHRAKNLLSDPARQDINHVVPNKPSKVRQIWFWPNRSWVTNLMRFLEEETSRIDRDDMTDIGIRDFDRLSVHWTTGF